MKLVFSCARPVRGTSAARRCVRSARPGGVPARQFQPRPPPPARGGGADGAWPLPGTQRGSLPVWYAERSPALAPTSGTRSERRSTRSQQGGESEHVTHTQHPDSAARRGQRGPVSDRVPPMLPSVSAMTARPGRSTTPSSTRRRTLGGRVDSGLSGVVPQREQHRPSRSPRAGGRCPRPAPTATQGVPGVSGWTLCVCGLGRGGGEGAGEGREAPGRGGRCCVHACRISLRRTCDEGMCQQGGQYQSVLANFCLCVQYISLGGPSSGCCACSSARSTLTRQAAGLWKRSRGPDGADLTLWSSPTPRCVATLAAPGRCRTAHTMFERESPSAPTSEAAFVMVARTGQADLPTFPCVSPRQVVNPGTAFRLVLEPLSGLCLPTPFNCQEPKIAPWVRDRQGLPRGSSFPQAAFSGQADLPRSGIHVGVPAQQFLFGPCSRPWLLHLLGPRVEHVESIEIQAPAEQRRARQCDHPPLDSCCTQHCSSLQAVHPAPKHHDHPVIFHLHTLGWLLLLLYRSVDKRTHGPDETDPPRRGRAASGARRPSTRPAARPRRRSRHLPDGADRRS